MNLLAAVFLLAAQLQNGAFALPKMVDQLMRPYLEHHLFQGTILVARGGKVEFSRAYTSPVTGRYRIASITKTFTAAAIELLAQRGKLRYKDQLKTFLPDFPNAQNITIDTLLAHEAGLADPDYTAFASNRTATLDEVVANIASKPPLFAPGARGQYSNAGYIVLAKVVEVVSGVPFNTFIEREFISPLHLSDTMPDDPHASIPGRLPGLLPGPAPTYTMPAPFAEIAAYTGSGNLISSATDLLAWARAVAGGRIVDFSKLEYPYGWGKRAYLNHRVIEQSGEEPGFVSYLVHDMTDDLTVVVLSNLEVGPNDRIGKAVYALATLDAPAFPATFAGTRPAIATGAYSGSFGVFTVSSTGGNAFTTWTGSNTPQYLQPLGPHSFFVPTDSSTITVIDDATLTRAWGSDAPVRFIKLAPGETPTTPPQ